MALRAGIDIGTNTILLLVAEVNGDSLDVKEDHVRVVRLGQGVDQNHAFHPDALSRARDCFRAYREVLDRYPGVEIRAAATSGSRDAKNSRAFFDEIERDFGIPVRVISGEEEAMLSFRGALPAGEGDPTRLAVLDIGGGSSEIVGLGPDGQLVRHSFDMGCVRMAERFLTSDPATGAQVEGLRVWVKAELAKQKGMLDALEGKALTGVAGTATYLASSALGLAKFDPALVHGTYLPREKISALIEQFLPLTAKQRLGIGGMDAGRADVILAGALILEEILEATGLPGFTASVRGLRYGLVL